MHAADSYGRGDVQPRGMGAGGSVQVDQVIEAELKKPVDASDITDIEAGKAEVRDGRSNDAAWLSLWHICLPSFLSCAMLSTSVHPIHPPPAPRWCCAQQSDHVVFLRAYTCISPGFCSFLVS